MGPGVIDRGRGVTVYNGERPDTPEEEVRKDLIGRAPRGVCLTEKGALLGERVAKRLIRLAA